MPIYYQNVTLRGLLAWTNKLKLKQSLGDYAATRLEITSYQIDYVANLIEPHCKNYTFEDLKMLLLPLDQGTRVDWMQRTIARQEPDPLREDRLLQG